MPKMNSCPNLRSDIIKTLDKMGCRITGHQGVQGDKRHQKERPKSCHNVGCAVDITSISCKNPKMGLHDFATAMQGTLTLVCYQDNG